MKLLLDTHILVWAMFQQHLLTVAERDALTAPSSDVFFSPVSLYEIEQKKRLGKWIIPPIKHWFDDLIHSGASARLILPEHMIEAANLPLHHKDPWDRILIAQARLEGFTLISRDESIARYDVTVLAP